MQIFLYAQGQRTTTDYRQVYAKMFLFSFLKLIEAVTDLLVLCTTRLYFESKDTFIFIAVYF